MMEKNRIFLQVLFIDKVSIFIKIEKVLIEKGENKYLLCRFSDGLPNSTITNTHNSNVSLLPKK